MKKQSYRFSTAAARRLSSRIAPPGLFARIRDCATVTPKTRATELARRPDLSRVYARSALEEISAAGVGSRSIPGKK